MKLGIRIALAVLVALVGYGGLLVHDLYIKPYVLAESVVVVNTSEPFLPKYHVLQAEDIRLRKVAKESIPRDAIRNVNDVIGKMVTHELTNNQILTSHMVDIYELTPGPDESYFPIPKEAIYAINGSLRAHDRVDIYLYMSDQATSSITVNLADDEEVNQLDTGSEENLEDSRLFISNVVVAHVRTDDNQDVMDNQSGNVNERKTSTGRVSTPEIIMSNERGAQLLSKLEEGYKLFIVRKE